MEICRCHKYRIAYDFNECFVFSDFIFRVNVSHSPITLAQLKSNDNRLLHIHTSDGDSDSDGDSETHTINAIRVCTFLHSKLEPFVTLIQTTFAKTAFNTLHMHANPCVVYHLALASCLYFSRVLISLNTTNFLCLFWVSFMDCIYCVGVCLVCSHDIFHVVKRRCCCCCRCHRHPIELHSHCSNEMEALLRYEIEILITLLLLLVLRSRCCYSEYTLTRLWNGVRIATLCH